MKKCRKRSLFLFLVALGIASIMAGNMPAIAEEPELIEVVVRSQLTSTEEIYEDGFEGDPTKIIGFNTFSNAFIINIPTSNWVLPHPYADLGTPFGLVSAEIRFPEGVYMDTSLNAQIASGSGQLTTDSFTIQFAGTSIVRWTHDDMGAYTGIRWTDFSMGITDTTGTLAGWKGHVVGTRLLVGVPTPYFQSGIVIFRLLR